jgi:DNA-binding MarR family transcriptional regulator
LDIKETKMNMELNVNEEATLIEMMELGVQVIDIIETLSIDVGTLGMALLKLYEEGFVNVLGVV